MKFKYVDHYIIGFLALVFIGFWPSYFSKFFDGTAEFSFYFHFHAAAATCWIMLLIVQPVLIRRKKYHLHRLLGKWSYLVVALFFSSIILLAHHTTDPNADNLAQLLWIPFKDLVIFSFGYGVGILYRRTMPIHARGMIVAGMALIEPTTVRVMMNVFDIPYPSGYFLGISVVYTVLLLLIVLERKEKRGRWVFPVTFGLFLFIHLVRILELQVPGWKSFAQWFISLPLT